MKRLLVVMLLATAAAGVAAQTRPTASPSKSPKPQVAADPSAAAPIQKKLETFLRKLYAWGPSFRVKIGVLRDAPAPGFYEVPVEARRRSEEHTSELQSPCNLVCRLLLEKKKPPPHRPLR